jgi:hypothetical protein
MLLQTAKTKILREQEASLVIGWAKRPQQGGTVEVFPQRFNFRFSALAVGVV